MTKRYIPALRSLSQRGSSTPGTRGKSHVLTHGLHSVSGEGSISTNPRAHLRVRLTSSTPRICPGRFMALDSLWIAFASILTAFEISKPTDSEGEVIEPVYEPASSALVLWVSLIQHHIVVNTEPLIDCSMPLPFRCSIRPRNSKWKEVFDLPMANPGS